VLILGVEEREEVVIRWCLCEAALFDRLKR